MRMRTSEDRSGPLVTCIDNTGRSPMLTGELVPVDWHGLPVQVTNGPDRSSEVLILRVLCIPFSQQSAGTEPLALPDLTRLKPLPCPVSWPYQPLHVGPLHCPILWPYQPSHVRPSSSALYSGPTTLYRSGIPPLPSP